eukprot:3086202-Amphidinium_carterae.4
MAKMLFVLNQDSSSSEKRDKLRKEVKALRALGIQEKEVLPAILLEQVLKCSEKRSMRSHAHQHQPFSPHVVSLPAVSIDDGDTCAFIESSLES